jgi:hypothetical protein
MPKPRQDLQGTLSEEGHDDNDGRVCCAANGTQPTARPSLARWAWTGAHQNGCDQGTVCFAEGVRIKIQQGQRGQRRPRAWPESENFRYIAVPQVTPGLGDVGNRRCICPGSNSGRAANHSSDPVGPRLFRNGPRHRWPTSVARGVPPGTLSLRLPMNDSSLCRPDKLRAGAIVLGLPPDIWFGRTTGYWGGPYARTFELAARDVGGGSCAAGSFVTHQPRRAGQHRFTGAPSGTQRDPAARGYESSRSARGTERAPPPRRSATVGRLGEGLSPPALHPRRGGPPGRASAPVGGAEVHWPARAAVPP